MIPLLRAQDTRGISSTLGTKALLLAQEVLDTQVTED